MKQYSITTRNIDIPTDEDCILPENDPAHELKKNIMLGGSGSIAPIMTDSTKTLIDRFWKKE
jgi:hypothetical protein